jgi:hypothetical protein
MKVIKDSQILLHKDHGLVSPVQDVSEASIVSLVELLLGLKDPVLIHTVNETIDVVILELAKLVPPLGQSKVHKLALGSVLDGQGGELDGIHC